LFVVCSSNKDVLVLHTLQLLMLSVGTLMYSDTKLFLLIIFYNGALLFSKVLIILDVDECMCIFFFF
jgi:hypothetical protein